MVEVFQLNSYVRDVALPCCEMDPGTQTSHFIYKKAVFDHIKCIKSQCNAKISQDDKKVQNNW